MEIRLARDEDAAACLEIYRPFVENTAISFETEMPALPAFRDRIRETVRWAPWLVCVVDGVTAGFAYAAPFRSRPAYRWSVECTVYVNETHRRLGVGRALFGQLFEGLRLQGFVSALAVITLPNPASIALHTALGFEKSGAFPKVGYKLGKWHDVEWWRLELQPAPDTPAEPRPVAEVAKILDWPGAR